MFTRQRERQSVMTGMLFTYLILLFFATGCSHNPASSGEDAALSGISAVDLQAGLPEAGDTGLKGAMRQDGEKCFDFRKIWCLIFPCFCLPEPNFDPYYAWGGPNFNPKPDEVPAMAAFHNACLSSWRKSDRNAEGLMRTFEEEAAKLGLSHHLDEKTRKDALQLFTTLLKGDVTHDMIPGPDTVRKLFIQRPLPGPFANDEPMLGMLEALEDGISDKEVIDWQSFAHSLRFADPKEYWAASTMAASVEWWHDFSEEVGEDCAAGVMADLAAIFQTADWRLVALASLSGALVDVLEHFWPSE